MNELSIGGKSFKHQKYSACLDELKKVIPSRDGTSLVFVLGPTGVGKSHARESIVDEITKANREKIDSDRTFIPIVSIDIRLLNNHGFNWTAFYRQYLIAFQAPITEFSSHAEAIELCIDAAKNRRPLAVLIDEAQYFAKVSPACMGEQSEALKSLAHATGVKHVLFATYDANKLIRANGQLARRTRPIHFSRYENTPEDRQSFDRLLERLDAALTKESAVRLKACADYVYESTLGLVGVLRDWLVRAHCNAVMEGETSITFDALEATKLSTKDRLVILKECFDGESELISSSDDDLRLRSQLELNAKGKEPLKKSPNRPEGRVGQRRFKADPVKH